MSTDVTVNSIDTVMASTGLNFRKLTVMSTSKAIATYRLASDTYAYARCIDISGVGLSHPGSAQRIGSASPSYAMDVVRLTDTKAVALYAYDATNRPVAKVLDLSGSTISVGTETSTFVASTSGYFTGARLSDSSMLAVWATGTVAKAAVLSGITGTTITVNSVVDVEATSITKPVCAPIDGSRVLMAYFKSGSVMAEVIDISGTTPSGGNTAVACETSPDTTSEIKLAVMTDGLHAAVVCRKSGSLDLSVTIVSISGSTLTAGSPVNYGTVDNYQDGYSVAPTSDANVIVTWYDYNDSNKPKTAIISALNTVLGTFATIAATGSGTDMDMEAISTSASLLWFTTGSNDQTAVVLSFDAPTPPVTIVPTSLPMQTLAAYGGARAALTAPMGTLEILTHTTPIGDGMTAPMGVLAARGGARVPGLTAPMGTIAGTMSVPIIGRADLSAPMGTLSAAGTVSQFARASIAAPMGELAARGGAVASLTGPMGTLATAATVGIVARAALSAPMGELSASASEGIWARAVLVAPMFEPSRTARAALTAPMGRLLARAHTVVAVVYEAYAVNLQPSDSVHEVTRYEEWEFDRILRWRDQYYGVRADGVYPLGGDLDLAEPIAWTIHTGTSNLGSRQEKACREGWLHGRVGTGLQATVTVGEGTPQTYDAIVQAGENAQATRAKYGRGLKGVYWSYGFSDPDGGPADIDALHFDAAELTRKVY